MNVDIFSPKNYSIGGIIKAASKAKSGYFETNKIFHGSPNKDLQKIELSKSKQSENFMPHISATDNPLLAKSFTKGELGNLPEGKIYQAEGNFKIIDYTSEEGKKLWNSLGETDFERALNAKKAGFDGRQINNYEKLKIDNFYPEIDYKKVQDAHELQLFSDLEVKPFDGNVDIFSPKNYKIGGIIKVADTYEKTSKT